MTGWTPTEAERDRARRDGAELDELIAHFFPAFNSLRGEQGVGAAKLHSALQSYRHMLRWVEGGEQSNPENAL